jgi:hypothetical protein
MTRMLPAAIAALTLVIAPALAIAATPLSKAQAQKEIEFDGYTQVQNLHQQKDGWTATALEGQRRVSLMVDRRGDVEKTGAPKAN